MALHDSQTQKLLEAHGYLGRMMDIKEPLYGVCFQCGKSSYWVRNCPCLDYWQNAIQTGWAGHKRKPLLNFAKTKLDSPLKFMFHKKFVRYSRPVGSRWMSQHCRRNLSDCLCIQLSVISIVLEVVCSPFPVYLGNIVFFSRLSWG